MCELEEIKFLSTFLADRIGYLLREEGFSTSLLEEEEAFFLDDMESALKALNDDILARVDSRGYTVTSVTTSLSMEYTEGLGTHYHVHAKAT
jgi:hypothetical protein